MTSKNGTRSVSIVTKTVENPEANVLPHVRIVEQPRSRGLRFRYQCEQRRAGVIEGENSTTTKRTYPTIEIVNNQGPSFVVASCVTKDHPHRPHPHSIVGKGKEFSHGLCYMKVPAGQSEIVFRRMTIQCVKKSQVLSALEERRRMKVNPFMTEYPDSVKSIDLSCVRMCFQVFLEGKQEGNFNVPLPPIVTQPIYDKKSAIEFEIKWISHHVASVAGGKVICIISDKLVKDDIEVIFFCEKSGWEVSAEFVQPVFHKQVAVVLKTPPYIDQEVTELVHVQVMLRKPSNGATSLPVPFQLLPVDLTARDSQRAKRLRLSTTPRSARAIVEDHIQMEDHQAPLQLPGNVRCASKEIRVPQMQHSEIPNQQIVTVDENNPPMVQREFSNAYNFQVPPSAPKTPAEFKHFLDSYLYPDRRRDFSS